MIRRVYTSYAGARWSGKHGSFEYDAELAAQSGGACGGHWRTAPRVGMIRFNAEYNRGSAGFDPPYPTAHDRYGLADQIGWRNIRHLRFGADIDFHNHWSAILNMHQYWVTSRSGAVYTPSGVPVASVRGDAQSNRAGWEPDVSVVWSPTRGVRMGTGYAYLFAGPFLREAGRSSYRYAYLFGEYTF